MGGYICSSAVLEEAFHVLRPSQNHQYGCQVLILLFCIYELNNAVYY